MCTRSKEGNVISNVTKISASKKNSMHACITYFIQVADIVVGIVSARLWMNVLAVAVAVLASKVTPARTKLVSVEPINMAPTINHQ